MLVCPACRSEYVATVTRCKDCDVDLVPPEAVEEAAVAQSPREALKDVPTVGLVSASLSSCREIEAALLDAGILAYVDGRYEEGEALSAGTLQYVVVVAREDVPRVAEVLEGRFRELVEREGTGSIVTEAIDLEAEEVTCPACGHRGPLDEEGACADCGLVLGVPMRGRRPRFSSMKKG